MSESRDNVIVDIKEMIDKMPNSESYHPKIFKVYPKLRQMNEGAYDPVLVSIGPIHHGKDHLKDMEKVKLSYLRQFLLIENQTVDRYVVKVRELEERARNCYSNFIQLPETDEFVKMMLLDGFFVIMLLRNIRFTDWRVDEDPILQSSQVQNRVKLDILLVENQLPFFILSELFDMTKSSHPEDNLSLLAVKRLCWMFPWKKDADSRKTDDQNVGHDPRDNLSRFEWMCRMFPWKKDADSRKTDDQNVGHDPRDNLSRFEWMCRMFPWKKDADSRKTDDQNVGHDPRDNLSRFEWMCRMFPWKKGGSRKKGVDSRKTDDQNVDDHLLGMVYGAYFSTETATQCTNDNRPKYQVINSASELEDSGIQFKNRPEYQVINSASELEDSGIQSKMDTGVDIDVSFTRDRFTQTYGLMQLPHLSITDPTETILRNLIAYEQMLPEKTYRSYVTDYTIFMTYLVKSTKDVEILRHADILANRIGGDDVLCDMFNMLGKHVMVSEKKFRYLEVCDQVDKHCSRPCNRWMAMLRRDYFNSPWAILSVIAAVILLLLTALQTGFTIFPSE